MNTTKITKLISTITCEKDFEDCIHLFLQEDGFDTHHHVDNDNGVPDLSYGKNGINGFLEIKYGPTRRTKIRASQAKWLSKRALSGGYCFLVWYQYDKRSKEIRTFMFDYTRFMLRVVEGGLTVQTLGVLRDFLVQPLHPDSMPPATQHQYRKRRKILLADLLKFRELSLDKKSPSMDIQV